MIETWVFNDGAVPATAAVAPQMLRDRITAGQLETWFTSSRGRSLAVLSNTDRAMVLLLDSEDDPGQHAISPAADGSSMGFVLVNGQHDEYPDEDTVPLTEALRIISHILDTGLPPVGAAWSIDR
ncbi:hypothetical protein [Streptomyces sp. NPDC087300]|uniref:hypothetical protein n=1 Tax=Streptomyces sp. NPDC087300 TaxID=3365780 RepID=UPI0038075717